MSNPRQKKARRPRAARKAGRGICRGGQEPPRTHLLNPKFTFGAKGQVESITGTCSEPGCSNERKIKPQDAFQVRRCVECQRKAVRGRIAKKGRARSAGRRKRL